LLADIREPDHFCIRDLCVCGHVLLGNLPAADNSDSNRSLAHRADATVFLRSTTAFLAG